MNKKGFSSASLSSYNSEIISDVQIDLLKQSKVGDRYLLQQLMRTPSAVYFVLREKNDIPAGAACEVAAVRAG